MRLAMLLAPVMRLAILLLAPVATARCTAIAVDAAASTNGSSFAGMNADCSGCDGRVTRIPRRKNGPERPIYIFSGSAPRFIGFGRGAFYEPKEGETAQDPIALIPETTQISYAYLESTLPLMNEKGLGLGESSCGSRLMNYAIGQAPKDGREHMEGLLDISTIMQLVLERCATSRCGVKILGSLVEQYGFVPMKGEWSIGVDRANPNATVFADGGETLTLADKSGEAWVVHLVGGVAGVTKTVWVAQRVPPGHIAVIANNFIIREVPTEQQDDFLFSSSIRDAAVKAGLWNGSEPLDFSRVFAPNTVTASAIGEEPIPMYASLRQWAILNTVQPSRKWRLELDPLNFPSYVIPEAKLSPIDVQNWLSQIYEGTEFDMTQSILSGPFGNPFPSEGGPSMAFGQIPRGISIARTVYSIVNECPVGTGLATSWYAADTPVTSVYVPFFAAALESVSPYYSQGVHTKFSRDSAWWAFDFVSNWASSINFRNATQENIYPLKMEFQSQISRGKLEFDRNLSAAATWTLDIQTKVVEAWWDMADALVVKYNDGFYNDVSKGEAGIGGHVGYPVWWAKMIGFNNDIHPIFVLRDNEAAAKFLLEPDLAPPGFVANVNPLPTRWQDSHWMSELVSASVGVGWSTTAAIVGAGVVGILVGFFLGRSRSQSAEMGYRILS